MWIEFWLIGLAVTHNTLLQKDKLLMSIIFLVLQIVSFFAEPIFGFLGILLGVIIELYLILLYFDTLPKSIALKTSTILDIVYSFNVLISIVYTIKFLQPFDVTEVTEITHVNEEEEPMLGLTLEMFSKASPDISRESTPFGRINTPKVGIPEASKVLAQTALEPKYKIIDFPENVQVTSDEVEQTFNSIIKQFPDRKAELEKTRDHQKKISRDITEFRLYIESLLTKLFANWLQNQSNKYKVTWDKPFYSADDLRKILGDLDDPDNDVNFSETWGSLGHDQTEVTHYDEPVVEMDDLLQSDVARKWEKVLFQTLVNAQFSKWGIK